MFIGGIALEKHALDVMVLHTAALTSIADYLVIGSGNSERHVKAIAEAIRLEMSRRFGERGAREGETAGTWILIDYGDIIVHIFREDIRMYYAVEKMWSDAPQIPQTDYETSVGSLSTRRTALIPASVAVPHHAH